VYYSHFTYRVCYNLNVKLRCQKVKWKETDLSWKVVHLMSRLGMSGPTHLLPLYLQGLQKDTFILLRVMPTELKFHIFCKNVISHFVGTTRHVGNVATTWEIKKKSNVSVWLMGKCEKYGWMHGHDNSHVRFSYKYREWTIDVRVYRFAIILQRSHYTSTNTGTQLYALKLVSY
jgi:hypothetical protein